LVFPLLGKEFQRVIVSWLLQEEKPSEVKIESSEKARGTDAGVNKRKPM